MALKKKLQVFVSSTYTDLREERQAAVEAILAAGHIPAGMELFAAGDETQMNVIKRWIDESDVYLLILGGRYGSLEPLSQKSYIQLEYEYALEKHKPLFAVVISDEQLDAKVRTSGRAVFETEQPQKLKEFRALVLSRLVKFYGDPRDIKLAIFETLTEYARRDEVVGWIPASEAVNAASLAEEMARLTKENAALRKQLSEARAAAVTYNGLTFEQMYALLLQEKLDPKEIGEYYELTQQVARAFGDQEPALVHALWLLRDDLSAGGYVPDSDKTNSKLMKAFRDLGLVQVDPRSQSVAGTDYIFTAEGKQFILRLTVEHGAEAKAFTLKHG